MLICVACGVPIVCVVCLWYMYGAVCGGGLDGVCAVCMWDGVCGGGIVCMCAVPRLSMPA